MDGQTRTLPLWRSCLDKMLAEGVEYGKVYAAEFFEQELSDERDTVSFGIAVSQIRRQLEERGLYLSARGQKGYQYVIIPASANRKVMNSYARSATDALERALKLGTATPRHLLTDLEKRRLEKAQERIAVRAALMSRASRIYRHVAKTAAKLLNGAKPEDNGGAKRQRR